MAVKAHIHRYMFTQLRFAKVWKCSLPDCNHYFPPHQGSPLGKFSLCWGCGIQFVLDETAMESEMPECINCRVGTKENPIVGEISLIDAYLNEKLK